MNKQEILNRLDKSVFYQEFVPSLKVNRKPEALGLCPFHDDHSPSLSVNLESGLFRCLACDAKGDIFTFYQKHKGVDFPTALKEMGKMAGIVESDTKSKVVATFKYTDEAGNLLYTKERIEPGRNGRSKEFVFKHLVNGKWTLGRGCDPVLYNLPEIIKSKYAFVCEGEAKADLLNSWGFTATCLDSGANSPWKDAYLKAFEGKVIILSDNDTPGREYATRIAIELHGNVKELKVIELPGLGEAEDVIDWSKTPGNNKEKLVEIIKETSAFQLSVPIETRKAGKLKTSTIRDILAYPSPEYLVEPIIHKNTSNLLTAYAGSYKSLIAMSITHAFLTGQPLWGYFKVLETGNVLIVDEENPGVFLKDRLIKMGFTEDMPLYFLHYQSVKLDNPQCFNELLEVIKQTKPVLVIFDALIRLHNAKENDNSEMSYVMGKIRDLINQTGVTVLTIHHCKKGGGDKKEGARGGSDIVGAVDNQLCLEVKEDETLVLSSGKCRAQSVKPIKLKLKSEGETLSFVYLGRELSESEEITNEVIEILGGANMGIDDIKKGLESKGYEVGVHKLRNILKLATGKELLADKGTKGRLAYRANSSFTEGGPTGRKAETLDIKGGETCFPALQPYIGMESCKAETESKSLLSSFTEGGLESCKAGRKVEVVTLDDFEVEDA